MKLHFTDRSSNPPRTVGPDELDDYAKMIGLAAAAPGRYSALLVMQAMTWSERFGVDAVQIVDEIRHLEGRGPATQTKPATKFSDDGDLAGLWHKHFTSATPNMMIRNIQQARPDWVTELIAREELTDLSRESIARFADRFVIGGYERQASAGKLTGEWIVYIEHEGARYYLCLATHAGGNAEVRNYIQTVCWHEFPFLRERLPQLFSPQ